MGPRLEISVYEAVAELIARLGLSLPRAHFTVRYNVPPLTPVWAVYSRFQTHHLTPAEWAMVPLWAKPGQFPRPLTVARAETVWERASYKNLMRRYRAIIPVTGFYAWTTAAGSKQPWHVRNRQANALALGALYQHNADGNMQIALITLPASGVLPDIDQRLPLVLHTDDYETWLATEQRAELDAIVARAPRALIARRVGTAVNDAKFDHPDCLRELR